MPTPRAGTFAGAFAAGAFAALAIGVGVACSGRPPEPAPVTDEEIEIVFQALLIESALQDFTGVRRDSLAERYYGQLYDRFGIDDRALAGLRDRLSDNPRSWVELTDSLLARTEGRSEDFDTLVNVGVTARQ